MTIALGKRVLITGSEGFTGRYMAAELSAASYQVFGIGSQPLDKQCYFKADLQDPIQLKKVINQVQPDYVVHLAALAFVGHGDANAFYQVNLIGTRNLLEALSQADKKPDAILLASSANVYGNQVEGILDETSIPAPTNDYAASKLAMEYMAHTWTNRLPIVIARPFNYTGVGQAEHFLLPKIVTHFRSGAEKIELGNLDVWRDFSDVRAVVSAYRGLLETAPVGKTFNVASGNSYSLREVLALCETITGHQIDVEVNPAFVRANEVKTLCGDSSALRQCIGQWSTPSLKETLTWMLTF